MFYRYYVYITGLKAKSKYFLTRRLAEAYMQKVCKKANISVECTEDDKHFKLYRNKECHVRFYINRVNF